MKPSSPQSTRILLVEDHEIVRAGLRLLVESQPGLVIVGEARKRSDSLEIACREKPDLVLLDLDLGDENGLDFLADLRAAVPGMRVIVLTALRDARLHREAVRLGAIGLVTKEQAAEVLLTAIAKVQNGEAWIDPKTTASVLGELTAEAAPKRLAAPASEASSLTPREHEVVRLIAEGLKNRQIAGRLFISETTVRHHLSSIYGKLGVSDRLELLVYAHRNGICPPER